MTDIFEHKATSEDFDKFADFIDKGNYSVADMLAIVCSNLLCQKGETFITHLMIVGQIFKIDIKKVDKVEEENV